MLKSIDTRFQKDILLQKLPQEPFSHLTSRNLCSAVCQMMDHKPHGCISKHHIDGSTALSPGTSVLPAGLPPTDGHCHKWPQLLHRVTLRRKHRELPVQNVSTHKLKSCWKFYLWLSESKKNKSEVSWNWDTRGLCEYTISKGTTHQWFPPMKSKREIQITDTSDSHRGSNSFKFYLIKVKTWININTAQVLQIILHICVQTDWWM